MDGMEEMENLPQKINDNTDDFEPKLPMNIVQ